MGFALGYYEEATELVGTGTVIDSISAPLIEYLHATIVAGEAMCLSMPCGFKLIVRSRLFLIFPLKKSTVVWGNVRKRVVSYCEL